MSVYVDNMYQLELGRFGRMKMSHMYADTHEELVAMADQIGVARKWIQYPGHLVKEHFDISMTMRARAVVAGAVETDILDYARWAGYKRSEVAP